MPGKRPPPDEAYTSVASWFRNRTPMRKDVWLMLEGRSQRQAFTAAGVAQLSLLSEVQESLSKAIHAGTSLEEWKASIRTKLEREWAGTVQNPSARMDNIFRTNVQTAYAQGRREQMLEPEVLRFRPYFRYIATLDSRTSTICRAIDGTLLPATDSFWASHTPPLHFQCRGTIQSLSRPEAHRRGITEDTPRVAAQEGFGSVNHPWQPDLKGFPPTCAPRTSARPGTCRRPSRRTLRIHRPGRRPSRPRLASPRPPCRRPTRFIRRPRRRPPRPPRRAARCEVPRATRSSDAFPSSRPRSATGCALIKPRRRPGTSAT